MKLKFITVAALALFFTTTITYAQNMAIGIRAGASFNVIHNDDLVEDALIATGLNIAVPLELSFTPNFALQPELHFVQKGVAFETKSETGVDLRTVTKTNYLELPVLFKGTLVVEDLTVFAFVGPSVGYALNRYQVQDVGDTDGDNEKVDFIDSGNIQDQRVDVSAVGGVGASMQAGAGSIVLDARYNHGVMDNIKFENDRPDDLARTTNRGFNLSIGYMMPLN